MEESGRNPGQTAETPSTEGYIEDAAAMSPSDERVAELLEHTIDVPVLVEAVQQQAAADAADTLETLETFEAVDVLEQMEPQAAAETLAEIPASLATDLLRGVIEERPKAAAALVAQMAPDDAVDLLQELDEPMRQQLLARLPRHHAVDLIRLIDYDAESAGGMMTTDYLALNKHMTVREATEYIRSNPVPPGVQDALVVNGDGKLRGIIGLRDLLLAHDDEKIVDRMSDTVTAVRPEVDREEVALTFDRYNFGMLPVVDHEDRLLGIVTVDDVIDIIRAEQTEDVQKSVGAGAGEAIYSSVREKLKGRTPWLSVSLALMCMSALVVIFGEDLIQERPVLAFLLPVIAAVVGNGGQQAMMVTLRGIVLDEIRRDRVWPLIGREVLVGFINGLVLGVLVMLLVGFVFSRFTESATLQLGIIAGLAMTTAMTVATLTGSCVPLLMRKIGLDPALAASIFLIMITDAVSFCSLLALTVVWLSVD